MSFFQVINVQCILVYLSMNIVWQASGKVIIGTKVSLNSPNSSFVTEPINVTINPYDEYHAFIMANNTSSLSYILIEFGSNDSQRGQPLIIVNDKTLNFTYEILSSELCGVHVTLLAITFDEVTYAEFLARASSMMFSDSGHRLIRVSFAYPAGTHSAITSYIELTGPSSTSTSTVVSHTTTVPSTTTLTQNPTHTRIFSSNGPSSVSTTSINAATRASFYVTTIAVSLFTCLCSLLCQFVH